MLGFILPCMQGVCCNVRSLLRSLGWFWINVFESLNGSKALVYPKNVMMLGAPWTCAARPKLWHHIAFTLREMSCWDIDIYIYIYIEISQSYEYGTLLNSICYENLSRIMWIARMSKEQWATDTKPRHSSSMLFSFKKIYQLAHLPEHLCHSYITIFIL